MRDTNENEIRETYRGHRELDKHIERKGGDAYEGEGETEAVQLNTSGQVEDSSRERKGVIRLSDYISAAIRGLRRPLTPFEKSTPDGTFQHDV